MNEAQYEQSLTLKGYFHIHLLKLDASLYISFTALNNLWYVILNFTLKETHLIQFDLHTNRFAILQLNGRDVFLRI